MCASSGASALGVSQSRWSMRLFVSMWCSTAGLTFPAVQLVYELIVKVRGGEELQSLAQLSDEVAYAAGVQIAADVRQLFRAATQQQLLAAEARANGESGWPPLPPPIVFVHVTQLHTQVVETRQEVGVASQLASFSSKLATKVGRWSAKKFSQNPELIDVAGKTVFGAATAAV